MMTGPNITIFRCFVFSLFLLGSVSAQSDGTAELLISQRGELLYSTDFSRLDDWRISSGTWEFSDDTLSATQTAGETHAAHMVMRRNDFKNIIIEYEVLLGEASTVQMTIDDRPKKLGRIILDPKKFTGIQTHRLQKTHPIEKSFNAVEGDFAEDQWHHICIEMIDHKIVAQLGGLITSSKDEVWAGKDKRIGLYAKQGPGGFRNLKIWEALPQQ